MPPNRSRPRLKDIADRAGVSVAAASMALSGHPDIKDETRRRVRQISADLGYRRRSRAAPQPRRGELDRVGLLIVGGEGQDAVNTPLMAALSDAGYERRVRVEYAVTSDALTAAELARRAIQFARGLDGLLLVGLVDAALLAALRAAGVPHVVMGHVLGRLGEAQSLGASIVAFDHFAMGLVAARWLLARGHARIAFLCEAAPPGLNHDRWLWGYRMAHLEAGRPVDPRLVQVTGVAGAGAAPAVDAWLRHGELPAAYVVPDARVAATLVSECRARGVALPDEALVFEAVGGASLGPDLVDRPCLIGRCDLLARHCLEQLQRTYADPRQPAVRIVAPFEMHGLEQPETGAGQDPLPKPEQA